MVWSTWSYIYIYEYIYICVYLFIFPVGGVVVVAVGYTRACIHLWPVWSGHTCIFICSYKYFTWSDTRPSACLIWERRPTARSSVDREITGAKCWTLILVSLLEHTPLWHPHTFRKGGHDRGGGMMEPSSKDHFFKWSLLPRITPDWLSTTRTDSYDSYYSMTLYILYNIYNIYIYIYIYIHTYISQCLVKHILAMFAKLFGSCFSNGGGRFFNGIYIYI